MELSEEDKRVTVDGQDKECECLVGERKNGWGGSLIMDDHVSLGMGYTVPYQIGIDQPPLNIQCQCLQ